MRDLGNKHGTLPKTVPSYKDLNSSTRGMHGSNASSAFNTGSNTPSGSMMPYQVNQAMSQGIPYRPVTNVLKP